MSEDRACLVVERAVAILTEIPLKLSIAAVSDRPVRTAARASNTVTPANLRQQVRCDRSEPNTSSGIIRVGHRYRAALVLFDFTATAQQYQQSPTDERTVVYSLSVLVLHYGCHLLHLVFQIKILRILETVLLERIV